MDVFNKLKNLKNRFLNSGSWGEFFASCFVDLDKLNKELEGMTETEQITKLKDALGKQNDKVKELIEIISKQNEQIEELTKTKEDNVSLDDLVNEINQLASSVNEVKALIEIKK